MIFLEGVYAEDKYGKVRFHRVKAPTAEELNKLVHTVSQRVAKFLERKGLLERDAANSYLALESNDEDPMTQLHGHSVTYRIAVGPHKGRSCASMLPRH